MATQTARQRWLERATLVECSLGLEYAGQGAKLAQFVSARVFTLGRKDVFMAGGDALISLSGKKLLAHGLICVRQEPSKRGLEITRVVWQAILHYVMADHRVAIGLR